MATPGGTITRKDIIDDDALKIGELYQAQVNLMIEANKKLGTSLVEYQKNLPNLRNASTNSEAIKAKEKEVEITQKLVANFKDQSAAEKQLESLKERNKNASNENAVSIARERLEISNKTRAVKQGIQEETSAYAKLNNERTRSKRVLLDLIAAEGTSTEAVKKQQAEFERLDKRVKEADHAAKDFTKSVGDYGNAFEGALEKAGLFSGKIGEISRTAIGFVQQGGQAIKTIKGINDSVVSGAKSVLGFAAAKLNLTSTTEILTGAQVISTIATESGIAATEVATVARIGFTTATAQTAVATVGLAQAEVLNVIATDTLAVSTGVAAASIGAMSLAESQAVVATSTLAATTGIATVGAEALAVGSVTAAVGTEALAVGAGTASVGVGVLNVVLGILLSPITLVVAALAILIFIFKDFAPIVNPVKDAFSAMGAVFGTLKTAIFDLVTGARSLSEIFGSLGKDMGTAAKEAFNLGKATRDLAKAQEIQEVNAAKAQTQVQKLILQSKDRTKTEQERIDLINEAQGIEEASFKVTQKNTEEALRQSKLKLLNTKNLSEEQKKLINANDFEGLRSLKVKKQLDNDELKSYKELLIKKESEEQTHIQIQEKAQNRENMLGDKADEKKQKQIEAFRKKREEDDKNRIERLNALLKAEFDLDKQRLEKTISINEEIYKDVKFSENERIQALYNSQQAQEDLLLLNKKNQLSNSKNTANDKIRIEEEYSAKVLDLNKKIIEEQQKLIDSEVDNIKKSIDVKVKLQEKEKLEAITAENTSFNEKINNKDLSNKEIEKLQKTHQQNLLDIENEFIKKQLNLQIDAVEKILLADNLKTGSSKISVEKRQALEFELANLRKLVTDEDIKVTTQSIDAKIKKEEELQAFRKKTIENLSTSIARTFEQINGFGLNGDNLNNFFQGIAKNFEDLKKNGKLSFEDIGKTAELGLSVISDVSNAVSSSRIANIDAEITKSDNYYANEIEKAGTDQRKKDLLQKEAEKKRLELEKKKREEQRKQAILNKAMQAVQITISTIGAVMTALRDVPKVDGGISAGLIAASYATIGAIQLAAVLATPIPKFKMGRAGGPATFAEVGDGFVNEIIEKPDGRTYLTPNRPTLTFLEEGDKVHSSVDSFMNLQKASILSSLQMQGQKLNDFQARQVFNDNSDSILSELRENTKAIKNQKSTTIVNMPKIDFEHEFWKMTNKRWN